ncbi:hypothetical protein M433DRAFT_462976 [Acidomyces richmondensis BFW]|nr:hypothetical protein M433DRAFT_462976 [Acidomyces richmondensis BFW]
MGAEQSKETPAVPQDSVRRDVDRYKSELDRNMSTEEAERLARIRRNINAAKKMQHLIAAGEKPKLIRSTKGDAPPAFRSPKRTGTRPLIVGGYNRTPFPTQSTDEILSAWKPRKEPLKHADVPIRKERPPSPEDEEVVLDFGDETSMQESVSASSQGNSLFRGKSQDPTSINSVDNVKQGNHNVSGGAEASHEVPASDEQSGSSTGSSSGQPDALSSIESQEPSSKASASSSGGLKRPAENADSHPDSSAKVPRVTSVSSPQTPSGASFPRIPKKGNHHHAEKEKDKEKVLVAPITERPPQWYKKLSYNGKRNPEDTRANQAISHLKHAMKQAQDAMPSSDSKKLDQIWSVIRTMLHTIAFVQVNAQLLRNQRMLHDDDGLPQLFNKDYPWDIRADAEELYNKWCQQIFETDLLRGIIPGKPHSKHQKKTIDSLDPKYPRTSAKFFGNGLLLNGQWWPTQLAAVRDGAHGATVAGISGGEGGAYSCIMSGGHDYPDVDNGDEVLYCGTDSDNGAITEKTRLLLQSEETGNPVRLIRSSKLNSPYAPKLGLRYDGLYQVLSHEMLDPVSSLRQRHRFRLQRLPGQDPFRGDGPEKRPTEQEVEAYEKDKRLRGYT